jgi:hypothetical protein
MYNFPLGLRENFVIPFDFESGSKSLFRKDIPDPDLLRKKVPDPTGPGSATMVSSTHPKEKNDLEHTVHIWVSHRQWQKKEKGFPGLHTQ